MLREAVGRVTSLVRPTPVGAPLRVVFLAGPGNVWSVYEPLAEGRADETTSHVAYSELFLTAARALGARSLVLTTHPGRDAMRWGDVEVRRIEDDFAGKGGLGFHAASVEMALRIARICREWRPDVVILADDPPRMVASELIRMGGPRIIRAHHCRVAARSRAQRALNAIDGVLARRGITAFLSASTDVTHEIEGIFRGHPPPVVEFLPHYRRGSYDLPPPDAHAEVLRVVYIGRIEIDKGALDVVDAAAALRDRPDVAFDVCGDGGAMEALRAKVRDAGLEAKVRLHGWLDRPGLVEVLGGAHLGIVPTRSSILEGFNQAAVESLLAGRPVITSNVVPALEYARPACVEVPPDRPEGYARAIRDLADDRDRYQRMAQACAAETEKFLRPETSFAAAVEHVLGAIQAGATIRDRRIDPQGGVR